MAPSDANIFMEKLEKELESFKSSWMILLIAYNWNQWDS